MSFDPEDFRLKLRAAAESLPKKVRYRAINALDGFDKALNLLEIDREMASFRAITAQEEAAAALFNALKIRRYPGAERLNIGNHRHKWALWPVLDAARMSVGKTFKAALDMRLTVKPARIDISVPLSRISTGHPPELNDHRIVLEDPLDMLHRIDGAPNLFATELTEIAVFHGYSGIADHLAKLTNQRNTLLYASDGGLPVSRATTEAIVGRRQAAIIALCVAIAILQTKTLQAFAMQGLESLLGLVQKADELEMPYPKPDENAVRLNPPTAGIDVKNA